MNNDKLKMLKQELRIAGTDMVTVEIVKPAVFFYSEGYEIANEGSDDKWNRVYVNNKASESIACYGITNAGLLMEALIIDRKYEPEEEWEILCFTNVISMCPLNPVGNIKTSLKSASLNTGFKYGGTL